METETRKKVRLRRKKQDQERLSVLCPRQPPRYEGRGEMGMKLLMEE